MKSIQFRVVYSDDDAKDGVSQEIVRVRARTINTGLARALTLGRRPLGNGRERDIITIEFVKVER